MLAYRISPETELQADIDVGVPLGVELLGTLEIIAGEVSLAAGWSLGLAARGADGGLSDTDLGSDLAGRHTCGLKAQDLLLLGRADRTAGRLADTASRRGFASLLGGRYASRARFRSHLTRDEALAEGEQGLPVVCVELAEAHHNIAIQTLTLRNSPCGRLSRGQSSPTSHRGGRFS